MLATTKRLKAFNETFNKKYRERSGTIAPSDGSEPVGSVLKDSDIIPQPSLRELSERHPPKSSPSCESDR